MDTETKQDRRPHVSVSVRSAYFRKRFPLGTEETGHTLDAATVEGMRYKKNEAGNRLFAVDEVLTPQQVQSYFSRMAAKLKKRHNGVITKEEITAAEEDEALLLTRATVTGQCQVAGPIVFESFNLCSLYASNGFSIAVLRVNFSIFT